MGGDAGSLLLPPPGPLSTLVHLASWTVVSTYVFNRLPYSLSSGFGQTQGLEPCRRKGEKDIRVFILQFLSLVSPLTGSLHTALWLWGPVIPSSPHFFRPATSPRYYIVPWDFPSCCHTSLNSPFMKFSSNYPI